MVNRDPGVEYTIEDLEDSWKKVDILNFNAKIVWSLNSPDCLCLTCYDSWLSSGRALYGENDSGYFNRIAQEEFHREQVRFGRSLDKRKIA